ncbi:hypothetical protein CE91St41_38500 [Oscillospiraceae bacterium]|nr:hypothetical protein CE91St40_38480 [Oscillospiraceae bacterium]BDF76961.1 hypothetical protein CE91St41_38500 [Oscillospiraceae bacterium]
MRAGPRKTISVTMEKALWEKIALLAQKEARTKSGQIRQMLKELLRERGEWSDGGTGDS